MTINSIVASGDFAVQSASTTCGTTLAPSKSCAVGVTFSPSATGATNGTLTFTDNASDSPQAVALTGTGIAPVSLSASALNFGSVAVGNTSAAKSVTLKNHQSKARTFSSIVASGDFAVASNTCGPSIAAGATRAVGVTVSPAATGQDAGTLTFTDDAANSPQAVSLTGTGSLPVTVSPSSLTFGSLSVGATSAARTVTLTNHLNVSLNVLGFSPTADFAVVSNTCGSSVAAGASCAVGVTFTPTNVGSMSGTLTISYSAYGNPSVVKLTGTGNLDGLTSIAVSPSQESIGLGSSYQFAAKGTFAGGVTLNITNLVSWGSSKPAIATVSQGLAASKGLVGTTTITARRGSLSGKASLTVTAVTLNSIIVIPLNPSTPVGTQLSFSAIGVFSNGSQQDLTEFVQWSSSDPTVATINFGISDLPFAFDVATALAQGTTTISATLGLVTGSTTLTVTPATLVSLVVSPANSEIAVGAREQFSAAGTYTDGITYDVTRQVVWSSSDGTVASISNVSGSQGQATAVGAGMTAISATLDSITANATLVVDTCVDVEVSPADPIIALETTQQFDAICILNDGNPSDVTNVVQWGSSNSGVATISNSGLASAGDTPGVATVTASYGSASPGSDELTVTPATLVSISVTPPSATITLDQSQSFKAIGTFSDGSTEDLTDIATWTATSVSPVPPFTVAVITSPGVAEGVGIDLTTLTGTATITATVLGISGSATLTVTASLGTYIYTGNPYTSCSAPYDTSDCNQYYWVASITLPLPLPPNSEVSYGCPDAHCLGPVSFTDGFQTVNQDTPGGLAVDIYTDQNGNIYNWTIDRIDGSGSPCIPIGTASYSPGRFTSYGPSWPGPVDYSSVIYWPNWTTCGDGGGSGGGSNNGPPGTWTYPPNYPSTQGQRSSSQITKRRF